MYIYCGISQPDSIHPRNRCLDPCLNGWLNARQDLGPWPRRPRLFRFWFGARDETDLLVQFEWSWSWNAT